METNAPTRRTASKRLRQTTKKTVICMGTNTSPRWGWIIICVDPNTSHPLCQINIVVYSLHVRKIINMLTCNSQCNHCTSNFRRHFACTRSRTYTIHVTWTKNLYLNVLHQSTHLIAFTRSPCMMYDPLYLILARPTRPTDLNNPTYPTENPCATHLIHPYNPLYWIDFKFMFIFNI